MTKVHEVKQKPDESPIAFLEWIMEAFCQYTPYDPGSKEYKVAVTMAFIDQASRDIRKKLQRLERLQDKSLRDLVQVAEKVYHNRKTEEDKEQRKRKEEDKREMKKRKVTGKEFTENLGYSS